MLLAGIVGTGAATAQESIVVSQAEALVGCELQLPRSIAAANKPHILSHPIREPRSFLSRDFHPW